MAGSLGGGTGQRDKTGLTFKWAGTAVVVMTVRDTGRGMTPSEQRGIFKPFSRLHSAQEGTGLGLNIARKAMRAHGGGVRVHSEGLGNGTTFTISAKIRLERAVRRRRRERGARRQLCPPAAGNGTSAANDSDESAGRFSIILGPPQKHNCPRVRLHSAGALPPSTGAPGGVHGLSALRSVSADTGLAKSQSLARRYESDEQQLSQPSIFGFVGVHSTSLALGGGADVPLAAGSTISHEGQHILVVDDDATTRRVMSRLVKRLLPGCSVATAVDGAAAVKYVKGAMCKRCTGDDSMAPVPDFITLDNQMPVMTGQQAATVLRAAGYTGRIVGVTGNAVGADGDAFVKAGVDAVVFKPCSAEKLLQGLLP